MKFRMSWCCVLYLTCLASPGKAADSFVDITMETHVRDRHVLYRVNLAGRSATVRDLRLVINLPAGIEVDPREYHRVEARDNGRSTVTVFVAKALAGDWSRDLHLSARVISGEPRERRIITNARAMFLAGSGETIDTPTARTVAYGESVSGSGTRTVTLPPRPARSSMGLRHAEVGAFVMDSNRDEPDWNGQRLLVLGDIGETTTAQAEFVNTRRLGETGQLGSLALWRHLTGSLSAFAGASISDDAPFARRRGDLELQWRVPGLERLLLAGGVGRAQYEDGHARLWSGGGTYYFRRLGGGSLSYRFTYFDNDFDSNSYRGTDGIGRSHLVAVQIGRAEKPAGEFRMHYLAGTDALADFVVGSGRTETFGSHSVGFAWRKRWSDHLGSHLGFEWEKRRGLFHRKGVDLRLIYYF